MSLNEIELSLKWACYTLEFSLASITFGQVVWCLSGVLVNHWWCDCIHWWAKGPKVNLVVCLYPSTTLAYPYKVPLFPFLLSLSPFDRVSLGVWPWGYTSSQSLQAACACPLHSRAAARAQLLSSFSFDLGSLSVVYLEFARLDTSPSTFVSKTKRRRYLLERADGDHPHIKPKAVLVQWSSKEVDFLVGYSESTPASPTRNWPHFVTLVC